MSKQPAPGEAGKWQGLGLLIFVFLCGVPALEMNGFGFIVRMLNDFGLGLRLSLPIALACATLGGAVGGMLICPRPLLAGLLGGLFAGPLGLLAVYAYTQHRQQVWNMELVLIQGLGSLPGVGLGIWLKKILTPPPLEDRDASDSAAVP